MDEHVHCWHAQNYQLTTYPPQQPEICCQCGQTRTRPAYFGTGDEKHGPYAPDSRYTTSSPVVPSAKGDDK